MTNSIDFTHIPTSELRDILFTISSFKCDLNYMHCPSCPISDICLNLANKCMDIEQILASREQNNFQKAD